MAWQLQIHDREIANHFRMTFSMLKMSPD